MSRNRNAADIESLSASRMTRMVVDNEKEQIALRRKIKALNLEEKECRLQLERVKRDAAEAKRSDRCACPGMYDRNRVQIKGRRRSWTVASTDPLVSDTHHVVNKAMELISEVKDTPLNSQKTGRQEPWKGNTLPLLPRRRRSDTYPITPFFLDCIRTKESNAVTYPPRPPLTKPPPQKQN